MKQLFACTVLFLVAMAALFACSGQSQPPEQNRDSPRFAEKLKVFVSILPQAYLVERVGGEHVEVDVLVSPGENPAIYNPTPKQMARLARARVYFRIGVPFENGVMPKVKSMVKRLRVVDTRKGVPLRRMERHPLERGADEGRHHHEEGYDPHIWLAPSFLKTQARTIAGALGDADPDHAGDYETNLAAFVKDIEATDSRIRDALKPFAGRTFYVFHPAYGYFADAYGLKQMPVEIEGKSPAPRQLQALIQQAKADNVRIVFAQPQFAEKSAARIAESIGGAVVAMDPLAKDVLKNLEDMAAKIQGAFEK